MNQPSLHWECEEQKEMSCTTLRNSSISAVVYVVWSTTVHCKKKFAVCGFDIPAAGTGKSITFFTVWWFRYIYVPAGEGGGGAHHTVSGWGRRCGNRTRSSQTPCTGGQSRRPSGGPGVGCYSSPPVPITSEFSFTEISLGQAPIRIFRMLFWKQQHFCNVHCCVIRQGDSVEYTKGDIIRK